MEELQRKLSEMQHEMIMWKARAESMEEFSEGLKTQKEILDRLVEERDQLKEEVHEKSDRNRRMEQEMLELKYQTVRSRELQKDLPTGKTLLITRERKIQKLMGRPTKDTDPEVSDWLDDIRYHIEDLTESQKIDTIMSYLGGQAKDEVKLRPRTERDTAAKILSILESAFKVTESLATLTQQFFNRTQRADETVQDYSLALFKLNAKIEKKGGSSLDDVMLRDKFIDGLLDQSLRRDLRRLSREHLDISFVQFRQKVLELVQEDETGIQKKTVKSAEVSTASSLEKLLKQQIDIQQKTADALLALQKQQQKTEDKIDRWMKQKKSQGEDSKYAARRVDVKPKPRQIGPCYHCGELGHIAKECPKRRERSSQQAKVPANKPGNGQPVGLGVKL